MIFVIPLYFIDLSLHAMRSSASLACRLSSSWTNFDSLLLSLRALPAGPLKKYLNCLYSLCRLEKLLPAGLGHGVYGGAPSGSSETTSSSKLMRNRSVSGADLLALRKAIFSALVSSLAVFVNTSDISNLVPIVKFLYDFNQMCASFIY